jgi:hypothetical protein
VTAKACIALCSSMNAVSFSSERIFLRGPLQDQTHCELVYRPFELQKRCEYFFGTHDEPFSLAMRVNNPDRSRLTSSNCKYSCKCVRFVLDLNPLFFLRSI